LLTRPSIMPDSSKSDVVNAGRSAEAVDLFGVEAALRNFVRRVECGASGDVIPSVVEGVGAADSAACAAGVGGATPG